MICPAVSAPGRNKGLIRFASSLVIASAAFPRPNISSAISHLPMLKTPCVPENWRVMEGFLRGRDDSRRRVRVLRLSLGLLGHPPRSQGLQRLHGGHQARAPGLQPADPLDIAGGLPARHRALLRDA